jgi:hypothetical protein
MAAVRQLSQSGASESEIQELAAAGGFIFHAEEGLR